MKEAMNNNVMNNNVMNNNAMNNIRVKGSDQGLFPLVRMIFLIFLVLLFFAGFFYFVITGFLEGTAKPDNKDGKFDKNNAPFIGSSGLFGRSGWNLKPIETRYIPPPPIPISKPIPESNAGGGAMRSPQ